MKLSRKYIWDYDIKKSDFFKPTVLRWYLERKIEHGDWGVLDKRILKEHLPKLKINPYLKQILLDFLKVYG
jgi:hypothetical protein